MALGGGQGQAVVLDNPRDPLAIYQAGEQRKAQNAYRQQQLGLNRQRIQDAQANKLLAHKYEDPGDRFKTWGQGIIYNANQATMSVLQNNPNQDMRSLQPNIYAIQGQADKDLSKAKEVSTLYDEKQKSLSSIKNVDPSMATAIMNQTIAKDSPYDVDTNMLQNIEQVPAIYDLNGLVADSVHDVKDQYKNTDVGQIQNSPLGQFIEVTDHKMRFKDMDKTMDYILRGNDMTDSGVNQKVNGGVISDRIRYDIAQKEVQAKGGDPNDVSQVMSRFKEIQYDPAYAPQVRQNLKGILTQLNQEERDVKIQSMGKFKQPSQREKDYENAKTRREEALDAVVKPFGSNGALAEPSRKASESVEKLRGADFAGGKVIDAKFQRGGYAISPEWMQKLSQVVNTPEGYETLREAVKHLVPVKNNGDKILFTTKTGTMFGSPETALDVPLDLSQPGAKVIMNAMMNQNKGEHKVYYDDLYQKQSAAPQYLDDDNEDEGFLDE
jgi:hypothetical protein